MRRCTLTTLAVALCLGFSQPASAASRTLKLFFGHTGESGDFTFKKNGRYNRAELKKINRFLRDWRADQTIEMDPAVLDLLWEVHRKTGSKERIHIVSAYRSPKTNATLRKRGRGVAKHSQHMRGKAIDFYIPGTHVSKIRAIGLRKHLGGVGYYPTSGSPFVHLDTGSVRHWPRMTRQQLASVFPNGDTMHVPTDGKPLKGYNRAVAKFRGKKATTQVASRDLTPRSANTRKSKPRDIRPARIPERTKPVVATPTIVASATPSKPRRWLNRVLRRGDRRNEPTANSQPLQPIVTAGARFADAGNAPMIDSEGRPIVPRARPRLTIGSELPTDTLMAGLILPRTRPDGTPFDLTPQERQARATLALAMGENATRAGTAGVDDALSNLYATADYDPGEWLRTGAADEPADTVPAIETAWMANEAADVPGQADDAMANLFAFADEPVPTENPTIEGTPARPQIVTASLTPQRVIKAAAPARRQAQPMFRRAGAANANRDTLSDGKRPAMSALSVAAIFGQPGANPGSQDARARARQSVIQMAYAAPLEPDVSASDITASVRAAAVRAHQNSAARQQLLSEQFRPTRQVREIQAPSTMPALSGTIAPTSAPASATIVAALPSPGAPARLPRARPDPLVMQARAGVGETMPPATILTAAAARPFSEVPYPLALSQSADLRLRDAQAPHPSASPSMAYRRAALVARLMDVTVMTRFVGFALFTSPVPSGIPSFYGASPTFPGEPRALVHSVAAVAHLPRTDRFSLAADTLRGPLPQNNPLRLVSR
ncbi:MAG: DUF882 domain-containing protein [Alphaproteobacteria bacterium]